MANVLSHMCNTYFIFLPLEQMHNLRSMTQHPFTSADTGSGSSNAICMIHVRAILFRKQNLKSSTCIYHEVKAHVTQFMLTLF